MLKFGGIKALVVVERVGVDGTGLYLRSRQAIALLDRTVPGERHGRTIALARKCSRPL